jgi:hypothetical protein
MASATDYAHQFNPGFVLDPRTVALVVVDMQYASGSRDHGLGRSLKARGQRRSAPTGSTASSGRWCRPSSDCSLSSGPVGSAWSISPWARSCPTTPTCCRTCAPSPERRQHAGQPRARDPRRARPAPGQAVLSRTTMSAFHSGAASSAWCGPGACAARLHRHLDQLLCRGAARDAVDRSFRGLLVDDGCGCRQPVPARCHLRELRPLLGRVASSAQVLTELEGAR